MTKGLKLLFPILAFAVLAGCASQPSINHWGEVPGFWMGIWHGFTVPFALIAELFSNVRIYAFPNSGGWYDLGFFLGVGGLSGIGLFR